MSTYYIPDSGNTALNKVGKAMSLERLFPSSTFSLLSATGSSRICFSLFSCLFSATIQEFSSVKISSQRESASQPSEADYLLAGMN